MTTQPSVPEKALATEETQPFTALCFTTRAMLRTISQYAPHVAQRLYQEAKRLGLDTTGPIQWIYTGATGDDTHEFQLDIVLPISQSGSEPITEFSYQNFPSFSCLSYTHTGPWSDFPEVYSVLFNQLSQDGYQYNGQVREMYLVVDLENQANCVTEIQIGFV